jgi:ferredoxin
MEAGKHVVTVEDTGVSFACGEDEFVIQAMMRAGAGPVRHGCCGGGCGVCRMRAEGPIAKVKRMSRAHISPGDEEAGIVLICCIQPRGDIKLSRV